MAYEGEWVGQYLGEWLGFSSNPGAMSANIGGSGTIAGTLTGQSAQVDWGGGFKYPYWQPYQLDKREWEKKVPAIAAKAIERVARSSKRGEEAEAALKLEVAEWDARYAKMLTALQAMQLNSLKVLRQVQLAEIAKVEAQQALNARLIAEEMQRRDDDDALAVILMLS